MQVSSIKRTAGAKVGAREGRTRFLILPAAVPLIRIHLHHKQKHSLLLLKVETFNLHQAWSFAANNRCPTASINLPIKRSQLCASPICSFFLHQGGTPPHTHTQPQKEAFPGPGLNQCSPGEGGHNGRISSETNAKVRHVF